MVANKKLMGKRTIPQFLALGYPLLHQTIGDVNCLSVCKSNKCTHPTLWKVGVHIHAEEDLSKDLTDFKLQLLWVHSEPHLGFLDMKV